mmetsp:Transcript_3327/g.10344  ORF Transcript_3327/g.10344 Transcript_3327/m.10344 type:complete len:258 (+) Transcript_3327:282-1055(+)
MVSHVWRAKAKALKPAVGCPCTCSAMPPCTWSRKTVFLPQFGFASFIPWARQVRPWGWQPLAQDPGLRQQSLPQPTAGSCRKVHMGCRSSSRGMWPYMFTKRTSVLWPTCCATSGMLAPEGAPLRRMTASCESMNSPQVALSRCCEEPTRAQVFLGFRHSPWLPRSSLAFSETLLHKVLVISLHSGPEALPMWCTHMFSGGTNGGLHFVCSGCVCNFDEAFRCGSAAAGRGLCAAQCCGRWGFATGCACSWAARCGR